MRLIANKPCSFGGRKFYIGDEIPASFVTDAKMQEKMRIITIENNSFGKSSAQSSALFTQGQVEAMIAEAVEEVKTKSVVTIAVKGAVDEQFTAISARAEEIQQVFSILQLNAEEGAKVIADVHSENVLILLHAADSRKTVKNAAKEQADKLFSTEEVPNESAGGIESTGTNTEGVDT